MAGECLIGFKAQDATFYRCFDRLLGSQIINTFLKNLFEYIKNQNLFKSHYFLPGMCSGDE